MNQPAKSQPNVWERQRDPFRREARASLLRPYRDLAAGVVRPISTLAHPKDLLLQVQHLGPLCGYGGIVGIALHFSSVEEGLSPVQSICATLREQVRSSDWVSLLQRPSGHLSVLLLVLPEAHEEGTQVVWQRLQPVLSQELAARKAMVPQAQVRTWSWTEPQAGEKPPVVAGQTMTRLWVDQHGACQIATTTTKSGSTLLAQRSLLSPVSGDQEEATRGRHLLDHPTLSHSGREAASQPAHEA
jgi:hypothetical protein